MTLSEVMSTVDILKPNGYDEEFKTRWVNDLEAQVFEQVFSRAENNEKTLYQYEWDKDAQKELSVPAPYDSVYVHYLVSQIDYFNGEFDRYNNSLAVFEGAWNDFAAYWRRNNKPKRGRGFHLAKWRW